MEPISTVLLSVPVLLAIQVAQWFAARRRWQAEELVVKGSGAYREGSVVTLAPPKFPKRLVLLSTAVTAWGLMTFAFVAAGGLYALVLGERNPAAAVFSVLVSLSGLALGVNFLRAASRLLRRSEGSPQFAKRVALHGLGHHLVVFLTFSVINLSEAQGMEFLGAVGSACVLGLLVSGALAWQATRIERTWHFSR